MAIYTKKGDTGETSLFEPDPKKRTRISKADARIEAIGSVDELNSYLGIANTHCKNKRTNTFISDIQKDLFEIGAMLSQAPLQLSRSRVKALEKYIDEVEEYLPPLKNFLMPEGTVSAVHFMYARSLARRAERSIVRLHNKTPVPQEVLEYLNRLSDFLFIMFRQENKDLIEERRWVNQKD